MSKKKSIGTVTLGYGSSGQREVEIKDFLRCEHEDHRLISIVKTEEDGYLFCVENPASTGRSTEQKMYLTEGSAVALFSTYMLYFTHHGVDMQQLFEKYRQSGDILKYEFNQREERSKE